MRLFSIGLSFLAVAYATGLAAAEERELYIVRMADPPSAIYGGERAGFAATRAQAGPFDAASEAVTRYTSYLHAAQDAALAAVGAPPPVHRYDAVLNGVAVRLTAAEAARLARVPGVASVQPSGIRHIDTTHTGEFLGLSTKGGVWSQPVGKRLNRGDNIIVGVLDTGIQPENPSFYDRVNGAGRPVASGGRVAYGAVPARWKGACAGGTGFKCNKKLIGARHFSDAVAAAGFPLADIEYAASARDSDGHGSHTASTAAGNAKSPAIFAGVDYGRMAGVAPRARIAAYKVCWTYVEKGAPVNGCFDGDIIAAVDAAVKDGVDVINYSISGTLDNLHDPIEVAFRNAAAAGVFVSASAGNEGPGNTLNHPTPWVTTVAASTHDRTYTATVTLGNGTSYTGSSHSRGLAATPLVASTAAAKAGIPVDAARLCIADSLDPAKVTGKVVVCDRGVVDRLEKGKTVAKAGGLGMILVNVPGGATGLEEDLQAVPTVHLTADVRTEILAYAATDGATAALGVETKTLGVVAPVMAGFSSRGPNLATPWVLKPEVAAPGVSVIAAYVYEPTDDAEHDAIAAGTAKAKPTINSLGGTSMAAPHVAGYAALLKQRHPSWAPGTIQSAMITSAGSVKLAGGARDPDRFGYGAGNMRPLRGVEPKLVYPVPAADYKRFACTVQPAAGCKASDRMRPQDLNLASLSGPVVGKLTFRRTVKNVTGKTATFTGSVSVPGYTASVTPASFKLAPGATRTVSVSLTTKGAPFDSYAFGSLLWKTGRSIVRSPVTVISREFIAPLLVASRNAKGIIRWSAQYGFAGKTSIVVSPLVKAVVDSGTIGVGSGDEVAGCLARAAGTVTVDVETKAGDAFLRVATRAADLPKASDDLDILVFDPKGKLVGYSARAGSDETVTLMAPTAQTYSVCLFGYALGTDPSPYKLYRWLVGPTSAGRKLTVAPMNKTVSIGERVAYAAGYDVASSDAERFGAVVYWRGSKAIGTTIVSVDPAGAAAEVVATAFSSTRISAAR